MTIRDDVRISADGGIELGAWLYLPETDINDNWRTLSETERTIAETDARSCFSTHIS
jgi:hypothetical protein